MHNDVKFPIKAMTRKEVAAAYKVSTKSLKRWMDENGIEFSSARTLTPKQVSKLFDTFGPP